MKAYFPSRGILSCVMICAALSLRAGSFSANFNDGQIPAGVTMLDGAVVDTSGGPDGSGCMKLTAAVNNAAGGFVVPDLDNGNRLESFVATFNVHMGNGTAIPADGFSFNFGVAPTTSTFGPAGIVYGAGLPGLSVGFDSYDNGTADDQEAPEVCVRFYAGATSAPQLIARRKLTNQLKTGSGYVPVLIRMNVAGTLDIYMNNVALFTNLFFAGTTVSSNSTMAPWQFSFCARTGGAYQEHWIDDINITTVQQSAYRHYVKGAYPMANNSLANVTNAIVQIPLQNEVDTNLTTMLFNGVQVPITWSGVGTGKPIATYDPQGLPPGSVNTAQLNIVDSSGLAESMTFTWSVTNAPLWTIAPGSRTWLGANETTTPKERSIAYSAASNLVYVASRYPSTPNIYVLDANTGADLYQLNTGIVTNGGNLPLNCVAVADDGTVYACNEANANQNFSIYRWKTPDSTTPGDVVYLGQFDSSHRWGDVFAARGSGANTQFLTVSQNVNESCVFAMDQNQVVTPSYFFDDYNSTTTIGIDVTFGPTNTFFLKKKVTSGTTGLPLEMITLYNTAPGDQSFATTLSSVNDYHYQLGGMAVDWSNNIGAGVFFASTAGDYDRLYLYDLSNLSSPLQVATYYTNVTATANGGSEQCYPFPVTHVSNANFLAHVAIGGGKIFALDCNNGIIAVPEFAPVKTVTVIPPPPKMSVVSNNGSVVISWLVTGAGEVLQSNPTLAAGNWANTGLTPFVANGTNTVTITPSSKNFYRLAK